MFSKTFVSKGLRMGVDKFGIDRAIALANSSAVAAHIRMQLDRLKRDNVRRVPCK